MFPVSNSSATIVDCLLNEARRIGGMKFDSEAMFMEESAVFIISLS